MPYDFVTHRYVSLLLFGWVLVMKFVGQASCFFPTSVQLRRIGGEPWRLTELGFGPAAHWWRSGPRCGGCRSRELDLRRIGGGWGRGVEVAGAGIWPP